MYEVYATISVLVIIVNSIEVSLLVKKRKKLKPCEQCLLSLSVADLLVGISTLIMALQYADMLELAETSFKLTNTDASASIWFSVLASIAHVLAMTLDRWYAVAQPIKHRIRITKRLVAKVIVAAWLGCLVVAVVCTVFAKLNLILRYAIVFLIPATAVLMIVVYSRIVRKFTHSGRNQNNAGPQSSSTTNFTNQRKKEKNLIAMSLMIGQSFLAFNVPFCMLEVIGRKRGSKETVLVLVCNSLVNPFVYFFWKYTERKLRNSGMAECNPSTGIVKTGAVIIIQQSSTL
eukprot:gene10793-11947_t